MSTRAGADAHIPWGGLAWIVSLVLWMTWAPFVPRQDAASVLLTPPGSVADAAINLVLLAPAGLVLGLAARRSRTRSEALRAAAVLAGVVALAEGGQLFVAGRHVSLFDGLLNLGGGMAGFWAALRIRGAGFAPRTVLLLTGSHLFFGVVAYMAAVGAMVGGGHRLQGWRAEYGVTVGEEFDASRDYVGTVEEARICARSDGRETCVGGGAPAEARGRLTRLATGAQQVELAATVRSSSAEQEGPTRIVTFSTSEALRNATLGQSGRDLVLRLRTPLAGPNGTGIQFRLPGAVPTGERVRVRGEYDRGTVDLASRWNGHELRRTFDYRLLTVARLVAWEVSTYRPIQLAAAGVVALLALFFPLGYGSVLITDAAPGAAIGVAVAGSAVAFAVMTQQLGLGWVWGWAGVAAATAALGTLAGLLDVRRGRPGEGGAPG